MKKVYMLFIITFLTSTCFSKGFYGHVAPQNADFIRFRENSFPLYNGNTKYLTNY